MLAETAINEMKATLNVNLPTTTKPTKTEKMYEEKEPENTN